MRLVAIPRIPSSSMTVSNAALQALTRSQALRSSLSALRAGDSEQVKLRDAMQLAEDACQLSEQLQVPLSLRPPPPPRNVNFQRRRAGHLISTAFFRPMTRGL